MEVLVPAGEARAVEVAAGACLTVVDVQGRQVGDLISFLPGMREFLSVSHTIGILGHLVPRLGERLHSNLRRPLWEVAADDVGVHDLLFPCCDPERYRSYGAPGHRNCRTNLAQATGFDYAFLPDPLNVFMCTAVGPDGSVTIRESPSSPGARLVLRSLADQVAAVSACPMDLNPTNGFRPSELLLRVET